MVVKSGDIEESSNNATPMSQYPAYASPAVASSKGYYGQGPTILSAAPKDYYAQEPTVVALPPEAAVPIIAKRGGKCCGCCCDYRRATFVVDTLVVIFNILAIIILISYGEYYMDQEFGDDEEPYNYVLAEIMFSLITLFAGAIGIYGSLRYNIYAVGFTAAWLLLNWMASLINAIAFCSAYEDPNPDDYYEQDCYVNAESVTITLFIAAGFVYPHVFFIKEVKQGIMSEDNYPREKYSCCCT